MIVVTENWAVTTTLCESCRERPYSYFVQIGAVEVSLCLECFGQLNRVLYEAEKKR